MAKYLAGRIPKTAVVFNVALTTWVIKWTQILPKSKALDSLNLSVIGAVKIPFGRVNVGMAHQSLNRSEVIPFI